MSNGPGAENLLSDSLAGMNNPDTNAGLYSGHGGHMLFAATEDIEMAMNSSLASEGAMSQINVTPLVDVMLVLLTIFMITAPMLTHRMRLDLPQRSDHPQSKLTPPPPMRLTIAADGSLYLDGMPISEAGLKLQLGVYGSKPQDRQPELRIAASNDARYAVLARILSDARSANMQKIGLRDTDGM